MIDQLKNHEYLDDTYNDGEDVLSGRIPSQITSNAFQIFVLHSESGPILRPARTQLLLE